MTEQPTGSARPVYSIGAVARMLGLATSTLRSWEDRYGVVVPQRSDGGQRLYSRDQVEQLRFVTDRVNEGLQAGEAHRLLESRLQGGGGSLEDGGAGGDARRQLLILLAERDPFAAELSEYFLRTEGYEVVVVLDSEDALSVTQERQPDLVVAELLISGGRGTELCQRLTDLGAMVLATSSLALQEEALAAGASAFILKPFEPLQLVSTVRDLMRTSALTRPRPQETAVD